MVSETWNQDCDAVVYTIVLILVVVEDGLRGITSSFLMYNNISLNPCCCGRWSQRAYRLASCRGCSAVLILVVVEDGLRACKVGTLQVVPNVLILVVVEDGLRAPSMNLFTNNQILVLILVVVEDGLRDSTGFV